jgi:hypothetical protein
MSASPVADSPAQGDKQVESDLEVFTTKAFHLFKVFAKASASDLHIAQGHHHGPCFQPHHLATQWD